MPLFEVAVWLEPKDKTPGEIIRIERYIAKDADAAKRCALYDVASLDSMSKERLEAAEVAVRPFC